MGAAAAYEGERLETMLQRADTAMYIEKRGQYDGSGNANDNVSGNGAT